MIKLLITYTVFFSRLLLLSSLNEGVVEDDDYANYGTSYDQPTGKPIFQFIAVSIMSNEEGSVQFR